eukprot:470983-Rhodomonas_salina.2
MQTQLKHAEALNKHSTHHSYTTGDKVWLSTTNLDLPYPKKFKPSYLGPFPITHMHPHSNSATLELPKFLSKIHQTFNVSLFKPYHSRDPSLGPPAHAHPGPVYLDHSGAYYLIESIIAEKRRGSEPIYTLKWVGWDHQHNTTATHSFLIQEPGGSMAIEAWQARHASVPTMAPKNRAAKHLYRGPRTPAPQLLPNPPP